MNNGAIEQLNTLVKRTVSSGVKPIELFFQPVFDCDYGEVRAYRANARINSLSVGVLESEDYIDYSANDNLLIDFGHNVISKTLFFLSALGNQPQIRFVSVACPTSLIYDKNLYSYLKKAVFSNGDNAKKLCLEFSSSVTEIGGETLKSSLIDIKAAGIKTAINGYGGSAFSMEKLLTVCPDYLYCDKSLASLTTDYEKSGAVAPVINLAKSLGANVIACGIENDMELREFRSRDAFGFIPEDDYKGSLELTEKMFAADNFLKWGEQDD